MHVFALLNTFKKYRTSAFSNHLLKKINDAALFYIYYLYRNALLNMSDVEFQRC